MKHFLRLFHILEHIDHLKKDFQSLNFLFCKRLAGLVCFLRLAEQRPLTFFTVYVWCLAGWLSLYNITQFICKQSGRSPVSSEQQSRSLLPPPFTGRETSSATLTIVDMGEPQSKVELPYGWSCFLRSQLTINESYEGTKQYIFIHFSMLYRKFQSKRRTF